MTTLQDRFNINSQLEHLQVGSLNLVLSCSFLQQDCTSTGTYSQYPAASQPARSCSGTIGNNALSILLL